MRLARLFKRECIRIYGSCNTYYPCPDMFTALIDVGRDIFCPILSSYKNLKDWNLPTIAIILESPHKFEYDYNGLPIGPARGPTGVNIRSCLIKHLKGFNLEADQYKVLLVEAISYQCSNGLPVDQDEKPKKKDILFERIWNSGGCRSFEERLRLYKPTIIINSCTGGTSGIESRTLSTSLNALVQRSIDGVSPGIRKFYSSHPSSKHFKEDGNLKEVPL